MHSVITYPHCNGRVRRHRRARQLAVLGLRRSCRCHGICQRRSRPQRRRPDNRAKGQKRGKHKVGGLSERLAHRGCNTGKGNVEAVVPWKADLFVIDPVAIVQTVDRLANKGGREIFCRCPTQQDADTTAAWLIDRISRLEPGLTLSSDVQEGGGQYLVALRT